MRLPPLVPPGPPSSDAEARRTARQSLLPEIGEIGQRRLAAAHVAVVGAGGLGAPVLQYLAAAGVGTITLIDDDVVDLTNLHRQVIHAASAVGEPKTASAARRMHELAPAVVVHERRERLVPENATELLSGVDLVIDGTDTFATRYLVSDTCAALGVPLVWGSVLRFDAQVSVFWSRPPGAVAPVTLRDLFPLPPAPGSVPSCAEAGVLGALCGIVGAMMATEAVKLVVGAGDVLLGRVAVVDALTMRVREVPLVGASTATSHEAAPAVATPEAAEIAAVVAPLLAGTADELAAGDDGEAGVVLDVAAYRALPDTAVLLDVREPSEFAGDALPDAVNLPVSVLEQAARESADAVLALLADAGAPAGATLVTYCSAGVRAARAALALTDAGRDARVLHPDAVDHLRAEHLAATNDTVEATTTAGALR
ncbi:HesA/MoeB/ThiF family protein [Litorihabitans aurantiacus]|uniref:Molybdopterin biosynthesis protein MoeZ n=1 Tax=Litorihabitans aurantiacus TaxID=1930061 RepID=A0AA38CWM7_9MICO|nr:ThiF family adenylyltransferase [Litorihabitans aurantiacus]GMA33327.1 molybdopterin biosynthesis protein MoeZ [Litorihabitans aurantiacus]